MINKKYQTHACVHVWMPPCLFGSAYKGVRWQNTVFRDNILTISLASQLCEQILGSMSLTFFFFSLFISNFTYNSSKFQDRSSMFYSSIQSFFFLFLFVFIRNDLLYYYFFQFHIPLISSCVRSSFYSFKLYLFYLRQCLEFNLFCDFILLILSCQI